MRLGAIVNGSDDTSRSSRARTVWGLTSTVIAVVAAMLISRIQLDTGPLSPVTFRNAIAVGVLLLVPRRHFLLYWLAIYAAAAATALYLGGSPIATIAIQGANALVVLVAAVFTRRYDPAWIEGDTERVGSWLRFTVGTVLIPFAVGGILHATSRHTLTTSVRGEPFWSTALTYTASGAVATFLVVPAILRLRPTYLRRHRGAVRVHELVALLVLLAGLTVGVMLQTYSVLLFLIPVLVVVLVVRMGIIGATAASLVMVMPVVSITAAGVGPFLAVSGGSLQAALLWSQLFLVLVVAVGFVIVALRIDTQTAAGANDEDYARMFRLFAESTDELIALVELNGLIRYVSSAGLRGEGPGSIDLIGHEWSGRMHPYDRAEAEKAFTEVRAGAGAARILRRFQLRDGRWRWYDCRLRLVSTAVEGIDEPIVVVAARDVTEEKAREQELEQQNQALEVAADTDPLTRLPNRRRLARAQSQAYAAAAAASEPLSLLVVDIDHFKAYNDEHGHARGDQALVAVAEAIRTALHRPSDVVARFGGEEFVVLLPHTDAEGAHRVADSVCRQVRRLRITQTSTESGMVTISVGVATMRPTRPDGDGRLFAAADAALYRAKAHGRSRIEIAPEEGT